MALNLLKPHVVVIGYNLYEQPGVAVMERGLLLERARKHGDTDRQSTWLALSDAICFQADVMPPDLVLVVTWQLADLDLCDREAVADGR